MKLSLKLHSIIPLPDTLWMILYRNIFTRKSLKIPKGVIRGVHRRKTDNAMDKIKKRQKDKQWLKMQFFINVALVFFLFYFFRCLSFPFYLNVFFPLSLPRLWQVLTVDMSNTEEAKTAYPSRAPTVFHLFSLFFIVVSCTISSVLRCTLRFPYKTMFGSFLSPVVCRRTQVLFTLFVFVYV